jgi:hypothetical protein
VQAFKPGHVEFSNPNWYEMYDKKGGILTGGKTGKLSVRKKKSSS